MEEGEQRHAAFRKTTLIITNFAIFSILANTSTLALYLITTMSSVNMLVVYALFLAMLVMIVKPFVTIFVIFKLDKNVEIGKLFGLSNATHD